MLDSIYEEINRLLTKRRRYITTSLIEINLIPLFILKYLCDTGVYSYQEIVKLDSLENKKIYFEDSEVIFDDLKINKLLPLIEYEDITALVKEYLNTLKMGIKIVNNNENKVCLSNGYTNNIYDITGKTTYITNKALNTRRITWFKFFDKVLNVTNKYITYEELNIKEYNLIYVHDFAPKYHFIRKSNNDLYNLIKNMLVENKELNVILHTTYKKISNMNEAWYLLKYLDTVVLYDNNDTFLYLKHKTDDNVSIINYDNIKGKSLSKLAEIMKNNRRQKDVLTKTKTSDIKDNYYRIGFKLYQNQITQDVRNINDIVAENTYLIKKLSDLNEEIEAEINKLINR